jgi:hypothetical protein
VCEIERPICAYVRVRGPGLGLRDLALGIRV